MANYENDIFARLQAGESVESIAKELTENLNKANEQYKAEQEAKAKEAAKRKENTLKVEAVNFLIDALVEVGEAWGFADIVNEVFDDIDTEELVEEIDKATPVIKQYLNLQKSMSDLLGGGPKAKDTVDKATVKMTAEDPIESFLNTFVR